MKRFPSSDNLDALISLCPLKEKKKLKNDYAYSKKFQTMLDNLDEEDCLVESREATEKKRRLSLEQVKALENSFNVENKLEPERKLKLAKELGLQPRQVAIWFQNRRARCKAKQLEKEYGILKANYDSLKLKFDNLAQEKSALTKELKKVKAKLCGDNAADSSHVKEESLESIHNTSEESKNVDKCENGKQAGTSLGSSLEDRLSHDNSSEVLVDDQLMPSQIDYSTFVNINGPCSMVNWFEIPESKVIQPRLYQNQFVKVEDQTLFSVDESCNIFSVDQAPTLHWYLPQC